MISIKKFIKDIYNKGNFKDYFNRNKLFLTISVCLVLLSVFTGINHTNVNNSFVNYIISPINYNLGFMANSHNGFLLTFINSIVYSLYTLLMGLSFSILSILIVVANEVGVGNSFGLNSLIYMIQDVFLLVGSLLVAKIEVRFLTELTTFDLNSIFSRIKVPLKDLILTLTIILVIVLIISIM